MKGHKFKFLKIGHKVYYSKHKMFGIVELINHSDNTICINFGDDMFNWFNHLGQDIFKDLGDNPSTVETLFTIPAAKRLGYLNKDGSIKTKLNALKHKPELQTLEESLSKDMKDINSIQYPDNRPLKEPKDAWVVSPKGKVSYSPNLNPRFIVSPYRNRGNGNLQYIILDTSTGKTIKPVDVSLFLKDNASNIRLLNKRFLSVEEWNEVFPEFTTPKFIRAEDLEALDKEIEQSKSPKLTFYGKPFEGSVGNIKQVWASRYEALYSRLVLIAYVPDEAKSILKEMKDCVEHLSKL